MINSIFYNQIKQVDFMLWSFNRQLDEEHIIDQEVNWKGPFYWPSGDNQEELSSESGVYVICFPYKDGCLVHFAGITNNFKRRIKQHDRAFRKGQYTIIDADQAMRGIRKEVWHGWKYARENKEEFVQRENEIVAALEKQIASYQIFIAVMEDKRLRERLESSIMLGIYTSKTPWSDIQDRGMMLRGRYTNEMPIRAVNKSTCTIYGIPDILEF